ncbi:MAG: 4-hydroxy-tetrahydrodipicolinate synthase [Candidatus Pelagibacter sp.]|nr:4-hydroxy-tetrahydrodipicolinate synthase [Candidatus Pelagibacter sp.]OUV86563.1 MAG: 4-hydroxy-tetrahydrodipicolinate synthase [Pelagibacteraceae bacterium TMED136]|tara:strand:+ start:1 stop:873 length:873 start_codon:yes stop_codon:yes gene_type:complete
MFKGSITALVSPFKGKNLDLDAFEKFIDFQISNGADGIVPCGTTGESPTINNNEHKKLIETAVKVTNGKIPVIAGTGSNSTEEAVEMTIFAEKAKVDAALVVTPYYNKPTQEGLYQHYKKINDNCGIPIIIYNIPGRSVVDMNVDTMARLYELKNIIGVKDATGDLNRVTQQRKKMGNDFIILSGNDENTYEFNKLGGEGCISVSANVAPKICSDFHELCNSNKFKEAKIIFDKLLPLHDIMFVESNPVPAKYSLSLMGMMSEEVRLPLVTAEKISKEKITLVLKSLSLI